MTQPTLESELKVFRSECEVVSLFFYTDLAIDEMARKDPEVLKFLNQTPLFWNTCKNALQTAAIIALGRIFNPKEKSRHNLAKLIDLAKKHPEIFSKSSLEKRRLGKNDKRPDWMDEFLKTAYEPSAADLDHLGKLIENSANAYEARYKSVRDKWFAHRDWLGDSEAAPSFAKTNIRELQRIIGFLESVCETFEQLFLNGRKPTFRLKPYSVKRFLKYSPGAKGRTAAECITQDVSELLKSAVRKNPRSPS